MVLYCVWFQIVCFILRLARNCSFIFRRGETCKEMNIKIL